MVFVLFSQQTEEVAGEPLAELHITEEGDETTHTIKQQNTPHSPIITPDNSPIIANATPEIIIENTVVITETNDIEKESPIENIDDTTNLEITDNKTVTTEDTGIDGRSTPIITEQDDEQQTKYMEKTLQNSDSSPVIITEMCVDTQDATRSDIDVNIPLVTEPCEEEVLLSGEIPALEDEGPTCQELPSEGNQQQEDEIKPVFTKRQQSLVQDQPDSAILDDFVTKDQGAMAAQDDEFDGSVSKIADDLVSEVLGSVNFQMPSFSDSGSSTPVVDEDLIEPQKAEDKMSSYHSDIEGVERQTEVEVQPPHESEGYVMTVAGIEPPEAECNQQLTSGDAEMQVGFVTTVAGIEPPNSGFITTVAGIEPPDSSLQLVDEMVDQDKLKPQHNDWISEEDLVSKPGLETPPDDHQVVYGVEGQQVLATPSDNQQVLEMVGDNQQVLEMVPDNQQLLEMVPDNQQVLETVPDNQQGLDTPFDHQLSTEIMADETLRTPADKQVSEDHDYLEIIGDDGTAETGIENNNIDLKPTACQQEESQTQGSEDQPVLCAGSSRSQEDHSSPPQVLNGCLPEGSTSQVSSQIENGGQTLVSGDQSVSHDGNTA